MQKIEKSQEQSFAQSFKKNADIFSIFFLQSYNFLIENKMNLLYWVLNIHTQIKREPCLIPALPFLFYFDTDLEAKPEVQA